MEAKNGADWEWHLIGQVYTLKLRVQAKRVRCDNRLRIKHTVKSSGKQQRDLLIEAARTADMKPIYCIYCTEPQLTVWTPVWSFSGLGWFQAGCLLANASSVPEATTHAVGISIGALCSMALSMSSKMPGDRIRVKHFGALRRVLSWLCSRRSNLNG